MNRYSRACGAMLLLTLIGARTLPAPSAAQGAPPVRVIATVPVGQRPLGLAVHPGTGRVFVANNRSDSVSVIDPGSNAVIATIPVGRRPFYHVAVDEQRDRVYVTNNGDGSVSEIDALGPGPLRTIPAVGSAPEGIGVHPGLERAYVTHGGRNLAVIDLRAGRKLRDIDTGSSNHTVAVDAGLDRAYISKSRPDVLAIVDLAGERMLDELQATGHPAVDPLRHLVYLADFRQPRVWVIDGQARQVLGSIALQSQPLLMAVDPERGCLYAGNPDADAVTIIDAAGRREIGRVAVGRKPAAVAVDPRRNRVYVANEDSHTVSVLAGTVCGELEPRPSPSPSPSPEPSATSSPTTRPGPSGTPSPSPEPSATPTDPPRPVYLPLLLGERCPPADLYADIALVLDVSTTMLEPAGSGLRKIDRAIAAARDFLAGLRLAPGGDHVSLVTFNAEARILAPLTGDRAALSRALDRVEIAPQSRIDLGLRSGADTLLTGRPATVRALVLLSDGLANPVAPGAVLAAAESARAAGITLYVVGLGPRMDATTLRAIAGAPDRFIPAESPDLLGSIYADLARRVPCPASAYWGRR